MSSFRQLMMKEKGGGGIPARYTQVDYIGTPTSYLSYINTGIQVGANVRVVTKIKALASYMNVPIFGFFNSTKGSEYYHLTPFANKWYYGAYPSEGNAGSYSSSQTYEIDYNNNGTLIINGTTLASGFTTSGSDNLLLSHKGRTGDSLYGYYKYYYFMVYVGENLVRDMIPVYDTVNQVYGMWDMVSKAFFGNAGTGTLIGGND